MIKVIEHSKAYELRIKPLGLESNPLASYDLGGIASPLRLSALI